MNTHADWPFSTSEMLISFPALCLLLIALIHLTVEFAPRYIRQHRVSYRPIQTRVADAVLILRLILSSFSRSKSAR